MLPRAITLPLKPKNLAYRPYVYYRFWEIEKLYENPNLAIFILGTILGNTSPAANAAPNKECNLTQ